MVGDREDTTANCTVQQTRFVIAHRSAIDANTARLSLPVADVGISRLQRF
jgi:hypothetical protein